MSSLVLPTDEAAQQAGRRMKALMRDLYPICRSITGNGVRQTLKILQEEIPLTVHEVPSGRQVFDWTVPKEWNLIDAYVKDSSGQKIIDVNNSNLHILNYSIPVKKKVSLSELKSHLFTLPEHPAWIPYRTSYYNENWGFCISHDQFESLQEDTYDVVIDTTLENGSLTYGEFFLPGETSDEVLISTHICHPSLCNDNLSGVVLATFLAKHLSQLSLRYSYRFLFMPGTIGAITWLARNASRAACIKHGLIVNCVGDAGKFIYKRTRQGHAEIDQAAINALSHSGNEFEVLDFSPYGYDERQFCSPGFNLPVGCLSRSTHGRYPQYHTSADNFDLVKAIHLGASLRIYLSVVDRIENNRTLKRTNPFCEPQLGKRGLYDKIGARSGSRQDHMAMLWVLNLADGEHSLLDMSNKSGIDFSILNIVAETLCESNLIESLGRGSGGSV